MLVALATYSLAAVLVILLPGPDTLVVLRAILRGGRRTGVVTAAGVLTGLTLWAGTAALGLAALLKASQVAYDALRIVGAAYLVWLGVQSLRAHTFVRVEGGAPMRGGGYPAGLVSNVFNPKVGVFFVTFLPGFVPGGYPVGWTSLLFGAIFVALSAVYYVVLIGLASRVLGLFDRPRLRRRIEVLTGGVLIAFGARLAVEG